MTLSALARTFGGIVSPICFAALRLMMNSNFVGCSTGRSAGFTAFQNLVHISRGAPVQIGKARAVAHKPAVFHKLRPVDISQEAGSLPRVLQSLFGEHGATTVLQHEDCVSAPLACGSECNLNILRDLIRLEIEASLRTPLRRVPSLLTLVRWPGWMKPRGPPRGRV